MPNRRASASTHLWLAVTAAIVVTGCSDHPAPTGPGHEAAFSAGADAIDVIVVLKNELATGVAETNRGRADEMARGLGLEARHTYGAALFGFAAKVPVGRLNALRNDPRVAYVDRDLPVQIATPTVAGRDLAGTVSHALAAASSSGQIVPWGVNRIGAADAANRGSGVSVYILDTGIDPNHPDLRANLGEGFTTFECKGSPKNCAGWADDHGHGTHVAGTVGALDNGVGVVGVAPEVTLHAVKVLSSTGSGSRSGVIAGLDWVAGHNVGQARIANMSLSGMGEKTGVCTPSGVTGSADAYYAAICNAKNSGVVIVAAAGNNREDAASRVPAAYYDAVITVSAAGCGTRTMIDGAETCAPGTTTFMPFSNWGSGNDAAWPSAGSLPVVIAAPGHYVLSTTRGGGTGYNTGTSMAAPHVAGVAALMLSASPQPASGAAFADVRARLLASSECTTTWQNTTGLPHAESFLNARGESRRDCEPLALASPSNLTATALSSSSVELNWTHDDGDAQFHIYRHAGSGWSAIHLTGAGVRSYTDADLNPSSTYHYHLRAVRGDEVSIWSEIVEVRTLPAGEDPTPVAAFTVSCGNSDTCRFTDNSTGAITNRYWDFGNGSTLHAPTAGTYSVVYRSAGTYTVTLQVDAGPWGQDEARGSVTCTLQGKRVRCTGG